MEEETASQSKELAHRAFMATQWTRSTGVAMTSGDLEESELDLESGYTAEIYTGAFPNESRSPWQNAGFQVAGTLLVDSTYLMTSSDQLDYLELAYPQNALLLRALGSSKALVDWTYTVSPFENVADERVIDFYRRFNLLRYLSTAITLIKKCFQSVGEVHLRVEKDPDIEDEWLVLDFAIKGDIEDILDRYDKYTDLWVSLIPWPERNRIRLSYDIL